jgi:ribonuclease BN (tRNA processing enzyme)
VDLWVLGANGTYPTAGRPTSGYLLSDESTRVWVDAGWGTFDALSRLMDPADLDAVIISHIHPDHCADVLALYHYLRFGPGERGPLALIAPPSAIERLAGFIDSPRLSEAFQLRPTGPEAGTTVGSIRFRFGAGDHPVPTLQVRADAAGRSVAYSADTGTGSSLAELAAGANTLLAEASFQGRDKPAAHHLTAAEAATVARQAGVERLILTHLMPTLDPRQSIAEASDVFQGDVMVAAPGLEVRI